MKTFEITFKHISGEIRTTEIEAFDEEQAKARFEVNFGLDMEIIAFQYLMKVGDKVQYPTKIGITLYGVKNTPYKLATWEIVNIYTCPYSGEERIEMKRGKNIFYDIYKSKFTEILNYLNQINSKKNDRQKPNF